MKLFINYRREDTAPYAGRLYDRLIAHFGADQVFIDIDQIEPGEDFVDVINRKVGACEIAIISIGPNWLSVTDASGKRRLDDEEDFVRMEIIAALERKIRVIPVLVGGARMPRKQDLPEALAPLTRRNAIELSETRFHADVSRLIEAIESPRSLPEKKAELLPKPVALIAEPAPPSKLPSPEDLQKTSASRPPAEQDAPLTALLKKRKVVVVGALTALLVTGVVGGWWLGMELPRENAKRQRQFNVVPTQSPSGQLTSDKDNVVPTQSPTGQLTSDKDKVSYSIGLQVGSNLSKQKVEINPDVFADGVKDAIAGKPQLTPDQIKEVMAVFEKYMQQNPRGQLTYDKDKVSYNIGLQVGSNLSKQKVDINPDILAAGIKDAIAGKPQLTQDQVKEVMAQFEKDMEQKQKEAGEKNKSEGAKFLEENKKKPGVKTTASGLEYKVEKEGTGAQPKPTDMVTVNYRGTLINGTEFDSSYKRGQPATFPVNGVIKGWTEALQLMKVGSKYQLFIPSSLAYGEKVGAGIPEIGGNSTLIFEVELLDTKPLPKK